MDILTNDYNIVTLYNKVIFSTTATCATLIALVPNIITYICFEHSMYI